MEPTSVKFAREAISVEFNSLLKEFIIKEDGNGTPFILGVQEADFVSDAFIEIFEIYPDLLKDKA